MAVLDTRNDYLLYLDADATESFPVRQNNFNTKVLRSSFGWTQLRLPQALAADRPDVYFSPHHWLPVFSSGFKRVIAIFDLAFLKYPQYFGWKSVLHFRLNTYHSVRRADKIITISHASKKDVIEHYGVSESKISVTHLGYDRIFEAPLDSDRTEAINSKYGIGAEYMFFLGNLHLRKNLPRLIRAYEHVRSDAGIDHKLVITGQKDRLTHQVNEIVSDSKVRDDIILTGYAERSELPYLMGNASLFLFPSLFEGFGIPLLEAMAAGTPIVTSNVTSMPEVAGDAALLVNPLDIAEIAQAIREILTNAGLRASLIEKGKRRLQLFSWEKTARETLDYLSASS
jgi:glycosyltransferase involved in cell wall biosynthesis